MARPARAVRVFVGLTLLRFVDRLTRFGRTDLGLRCKSCILYNIFAVFGPLRVEMLY
ncbi:hypothetical protein [uncultured Paenibacillus sp.]|uniref:hypothetical protein n=1 Tax=uncultured Paenibacillus sp. TaxID=227322 RepID=UPI0015AAC65A|nr:hypothetical protein [uncultured Paenibacillus sp.]